MENGRKKNPNWIGYKVMECVEKGLAKGMETVPLEWKDPDTYLLLKSVIKGLGYDVVNVENIPFGYRLQIGRQQNA